jgi:hypothetical protein
MPRPVTVRAKKKLESPLDCQFSMRGSLPHAQMYLAQFIAFKEGFGGLLSRKVLATSGWCPGKASLGITANPE